MAKQVTGPEDTVPQNPGPWRNLEGSGLVFVPISHHDWGTVLEPVYRPRDREHGKRVTWPGDTRYQEPST